MSVIKLLQILNLDKEVNTKAMRLIFASLNFVGKVVFQLFLDFFFSFTHMLPLVCV